MEANFEHMDGLIARCLAGEAGREEVDRLEGWINERLEHKEYFNQSKKLFEAIEGARAEEIPVNVDNAWIQLNARIENESAKGKVIPLLGRRNVVRIAASMVLIAALGFVLKWAFGGETEQPLILAATDKKVNMNLPDGSKVLVNKNSEIAYVVTEGRREVKLKGEAYFEVVHNEKEPFVVRIGDLSIMDIGTAFNVKAIPGSNNIEVLVEEGEVAFYSTNDRGVTLVKGQKAVYDLSAKKFVKNEVDPTSNEASYHSKMFYFKESTLKEVLAQINTVYESNIILADEKMGACRLSVEFHNEDIDVILSIIAETLDMQVERGTSGFILKGGVCPE